MPIVRWSGDLWDWLVQVGKLSSLVTWVDMQLGGKIERDTQNEQKLWALWFSTLSYFSVSQYLTQGGHCRIYLCVYYPFSRHARLSIHRERKSRVFRADKTRLILSNAIMRCDARFISQVRYTKKGENKVVITCQRQHQPSSIGQEDLNQILHQRRWSWLHFMIVHCKGNWFAVVSWAIGKKTCLSQIAPSSLFICTTWK